MELSAEDSQVVLRVRKYLTAHGRAKYETLEAWFSNCVGLESLQRIRSSFGSLLTYL
jgi:hypothetical protein